MTATPTSVTGAYVGTSGFSYPTWKGGFYPADAKPTEFLRRYAARLPSVELNTTFYDLPSEEQFERWATETPADFRFAVKMSRVRTLGDRLGPVLVQLPENRPRDDGFLTLLLGSLDPGLEYAFEFRHPSWAGVEGVVRLNDLAASAPYRYLRLHEPPYDERALREWADRLRPLLEDGTRVYCYFKHEDDPRGALYAERLLQLLSARERRA
jgi:uncharacterized protein YecE (DUF72 family)